MLTDAFFRRYEKVLIWPGVDSSETRFNGQVAQLITQEVFRRNETLYRDRSDDPAVTGLQQAHDLIARELGVDQLSPKYWFRDYEFAGQKRRDAVAYLIESQLSNYLTARCDIEDDADFHMKERMSVVEVAFRLRAQQLVSSRRLLVASMPGGQAAFDAINSNLAPLERWPREKRRQEFAERAFAKQVEELNTRFRQAGFPLSYHNGFVQITSDELTEQQVERPFWRLVADAKWGNVDIHMKEALDKRDRGERDAAFAALQALESTIKIISDERGWSTGKERGAHNYLDNLSSKANGSWLADWEREALKLLFTEVRNPFGHGPGSAQMPSLAREQTDWAIDASMTWIKSLVRRS